MIREKACRSADECTPDWSICIRERETSRIPPDLNELPPHKMRQLVTELLAKQCELESANAELRRLNSDLLRSSNHDQNPPDQAPAACRTDMHQLNEIHAVYQQAPIGFCVLDTEMRYVRINERMAGFNGLPIEEHIGRTVREVLPAMAWMAEAIMQQVLKKGEPCIGVEVPGPQPDDRERTWLQHWIPIRGDRGDILAVSVVAVEITAQKLEAKEELEMTRRLEQRVLERTADLRMLAARMETAQEAERQRIAAGLHDEVGQILGVCDLKLNALRGDLERAEQDRLVGEIIDLLGDAAGQVRSLTFELRSATLFEAGFAAAARELCDHMQQRYDIAFDLHADENLPSVPTRLRPMLYRGLRELLFNIPRHAQATQARIHITALRHDLLQIKVKDNGIGFDTTRAARSLSRNGGFGLYNLRERLQEAGGKLFIRSLPGRGTTIVMEVPLEPRIVENA